MSGGLFPHKERTGVWWKDHSLSLILVGLLVIQTVHAIWAGHIVWLSDQQGHEQPIQNAWGSDFWIWWSYEYNVSLVADTFGVLLIVILTKWFYERGSSEGGG